MMKRLRAGAVAFALVCGSLLGQEASFRVEFDRTDAVPRSVDHDEDGNLSTTILTLAPEDVGVVEVAVTIVLKSALEPCASTPAQCDGSENFVDKDPMDPVYGCADDVDNDADGMTDVEDPDCIGIQGWSLSVVTDDCFGIASATTDGTAVPEETDSAGSFTSAEVVAPHLNGNRQGAVSLVILSVVNPVILDQVGEYRIVNLTGSINASELGPGEVIGPCGVTIVNTAGGEPPLVAGVPVTTGVSVANETRAPSIHNLDVAVRVELPFIRGDCNNDGSQDVSDAISLLGYLFQGSAVPPCLKACDVNGDGVPDLSDAVYSLTFLFPGGPPPPPPYPDCADDPDIRLGCEESRCPNS